MARAAKIPAPFEPLLTRQLPGGSLILDENLLAIKRAFSDLAASVQKKVTDVAAQSAAGATFSYGDDGVSNSDGVETCVLPLERGLLFDPFAPSLAAILTGLCSSQSGTSIFRVRVGGTHGGVDGNVVSTLEVTSSTARLMSSPPRAFVNPRGLQYVKITVQSSAAGQAANMESMTLALA